MARPPMKRKTRNWMRFWGTAQPSDETKKNTAETSMKRRRPSRSLTVPGDGRPDHAADEDDADGQPFAEGRQGEALLQEPDRPGDDGRVEAEEQAAQGGDDRDVE